MSRYAVLILSPSKTSKQILVKQISIHLMHGLLYFEDCQWVLSGAVAVQWQITLHVGR